MQIQTVFKAGNSDVVAIPKALRDKYNMGHGKKVIVGEIPNVGIVIKKAVNSRVGRGSGGIGKEFQRWLKGALEEDAEILDQLA